MALDAMYAGISATERTRDPKEPPPEINDAYVKLLFAVGYGRLGNAARAAELDSAARAQLEGCRADPIHAWLLDAFAERIRAAGTAQVDGGLPMSLRERLDAFDRVPRFMVDRFREASWLLAGEPVDAITYFARRGMPPPDVATATRWAVDAIERAVAGAEAATEKDEADATQLSLDPHLGRGPRTPIPGAFRWCMGSRVVRDGHRRPDDEQPLQYAVIYIVDRIVRGILEP